MHLVHIVCFSISIAGSLGCVGQLLVVIGHLVVGGGVGFVGGIICLVLVFIFGIWILVVSIGFLGPVSMSDSVFSPWCSLMWSRNWLYWVVFSVFSWLIDCPLMVGSLLFSWLSICSGFCSVMVFSTIFRCCGLLRLVLVVVV